MEASRLKDISFEIKKGYVYGILGPNGSENLQHSELF
jgi:ABC-type multidrug transport system ATPase subunit